MDQVLSKIYPSHRWVVQTIFDYKRDDMEDIEVCMRCGEERYFSNQKIGECVKRLGKNL